MPFESRPLQAFSGRRHGEVIGLTRREHLKTIVDQGRRLAVFRGSALYNAMKRKGFILIVRMKLHPGRAQ